MGFKERMTARDVPVQRALKFSAVLQNPDSVKIDCTT